MDMGVSNRQLKQAALQLTVVGHRVWTAYNAPTANSDVHSSDSIRKASEAAAGAGERSLRRSVLLVDITTRGTRPAGISGVHENHFYPRYPGFVGDKLSQLIKCPRGEFASLRLTSPDPFTDASQILHGNSAPCAFSLSNQPLGNGMVHVASKVPFLRLALLEEPSGCLGPLLLESGPKFSVSLPQAVQMPAGEGFSIGIDGNVDDPQVNSQEVLRISRRGLIHFTDGIQKETAIVVDEIGLSLAGLEEFPLPISGLEGNFSPPAYSPNGHIVRVVAQDAVIVGNRASWAERSPDLAVQFVGIGYLGDTSYNDLSRKKKLFPHVLVGELVKPELSEGLTIQCYLRDVITGSIGLLHSLKEGLGLFWRRLKFDVGHKFHGLSLTLFSLFVKYRKEERPFLCHLKEAVSRPQNL